MCPVTSKWCCELALWSPHSCSVKGVWSWRLGSVFPDGDSAVVPSLTWAILLSNNLCVVSAVASSQSPQSVKPTSIPLTLGCEQSSSSRAKGGAGQPLDGHTFAWTAPPLAEGGEKRRPGQPSSTVGSGAVCTMAWTPLLLVLLSHCTGRDGPQGPGPSSQVSCLPAPSPEKLPLVLPLH